MINLFPYKEKKRIERIRLMRAIVVTLVALIVLVVITALLLIPTTMTIASRHALAQTEIARLEDAGVIASPAGIAERATRARKVREQFAAVQPASPVQVIGRVQTLAPSGITLVGFTYEHTIEYSTLVITGVAQNRDALTRYVQMLESENSVSMVDSPISNYLKNTDAEFTLTVTFK